MVLSFINSYFEKELVLRQYDAHIPNMTVLSSNLEQG